MTAESDSDTNPNADWQRALRGDWQRVDSDLAPQIPTYDLPEDYGSAQYLEVRVIGERRVAIAVAVARATMRAIQLLDPAWPGSDEEVRLLNLDHNYVDYFRTDDPASSENTVFGINVEGRRSLVEETNQLVRTLLREELTLASVGNAQLNATLVF